MLEQMRTLYDYALSWLHVPYRWGGSNPTGIDCSGLVQCILASAGIDPPGDQTAQALFDHFSQNGKVNSYGLGALAFYGKSAKEITHVGFCISIHQMVEAAGGGSTTLTEADAWKQNAYVKMSLVKRRKDLVAVIKPYYAEIGVM
jgi:cell wall-associated NlpC family hydrolase